MEKLVEELIKQNAELLKALKGENGNSQRNVSGVNFEKFDETNESFDSFIERFQAFLDIQNVPKEKRGKTLISSLSAKLYSLLKKLTAPDNPADKDFEDLKAILKDHLNPKPLIIPSRHMFLNRKQHEGESVSTYMAELRSLAVPCNYNQDMLNIMLRDVFVSGLRNRIILDRLFEEDDIDLEKTLKIALAMEKASKGASDIIGSPSEIKEFSAENRKKQKPKNSVLKKHTQMKHNATCSRCNGTNHNKGNCKYKTSKCRYCQKIGHIERACLLAEKKEPSKSVKQKQIEVMSSDEEQQIVPMYEISKDVSLEENPIKPPIMIQVRIENKPVLMEVDTGGTVSVMSFQKFRKISNKRIQPTNLIFRTYKGDKIVPMGYVTVKVEYNNQKETLNLYIVKEDLDTIFGREWLYKINLDWNSIKTLKSDSKINLSDLLENYKDLFDEKLGEIKNYECRLELKPDAIPVFCRPRPLPFAMKKRVEDEIDRLEREGIIEKTDISDWATPIVPVVKSNGAIRLCADYSVTLNKHLKAQKHPLPRIEEIFASLSGGKIFSKIDFSQAYLQMKVHPDSQKLLTISTHKGLYICKRLMFGINAAPAIWQKYIESVFHDLEGVEVFYDDARISAPDIGTHISRLKKFFDKCKQHGLKINKQKSKFLQKEIEFLGYKLNADGISKTDSKIAAIQEARPPKNVQEVQSFMGLVNFYSRFSKNLATLAYPLHNLTKKNVPFNWDQKCQEAFINVKKEICSEKILAHYDPNLPLLLSTDASPVGLGAILSHRFPDGSERPIAFSSRTLSGTEQKYSQIDKEALAIVWGVKKFYLYLKGNRFTLITDHKPLVAIFACKKGLPVLSATRLLHYALTLQAYQFDIVYRSTKDHGNVDCLSRLPLKSEDLEFKNDVDIFQLSQIENLPVKAEDLAKATRNDEELGPLLKALQCGESLGGKEAQYSLQDGCIMYGQRVFVPKCFRKKILEELHYGHLGMVKMKAVARSYVYWKDIDKNIEDTAKNCIHCAKYKTDPAKAKVHFWEYPSTPWERIHVDFAGPIFDHMFLLIVDAHSKWLEVYPLKTTTTFKTIECLRDSFSRFGLPMVLVSDNGPQFSSHEFQEFMQNNGIIHRTCAPFKPSSNGQAERYVHTLKQALRAMQDYPGNIQQKVSTFLMQYRKAPNLTTGHSPAMLFLKRNIRTRIDLILPDLKSRVQEKIRKGKLEFYDRGFNIGDCVGVRDYRSANSKWKFGRVMNKDGALHYTINVNGTLIRRHVDQMRSVSDQLPDSGQTSRAYHSFGSKNSSNALESTTATSEVPEEEQSAQIPATASPSGADSSPRSENLTPLLDKAPAVQRSAPTTSTPTVKASPSLVPRRSNRIRRAPKRLDL